MVYTRTEPNDLLTDGDGGGGDGGELGEKDGDAAGEGATECVAVSLFREGDTLGVNDFDDDSDADAGERVADAVRDEDCDGIKDVDSDGDGGGEGERAAELVYDEDSVAEAVDVVDGGSVQCVELRASCVSWQERGLPH